MSQQPNPKLEIGEAFDTEDVVERIVQALNDNGDPTILASLHNCFAQSQVAWDDARFCYVCSSVDDGQPKEILAELLSQLK